MATFWYFYFAGAVLTYPYLKIACRNHHPEDEDWGDVVFRIVMSALSWGGLFICFVSITLFWGGPLGKKTQKPPRWL
jgi:hypothetical protein